MSAAATVSCPAWCTRDHEARAEGVRRSWRSDVERGFIPDDARGRAAMEEEISIEDEFHEFRVLDTSFGAVTLGNADIGSTEVLIEVSIDEHPKSSMPHVDAAGARELAQALMVAADRLDRINDEKAS